MLKQKGVVSTVDSICALVHVTMVYLQNTTKNHLFHNKKEDTESG